MTTGRTGTPRVLHVAQAVETGIAHVVADHVRHQVDRGWDVVLACPPGPMGELARAAGAQVVTWHARRSPGPSVLPEARALRRVLDDVDPDVVHLHSAKAGLVGRLVLRGGRPTVFTPHAWSWLAADGALREVSRFWERHGSWWSDVVVVLSPGEADAAADVGLERVPILIPNDVDAVALRARTSQTRLEARLGLGLPRAGRLVVCTARLADQKGQDVLLQAWPFVREEVPGVHLVLVGDGPTRARLEQTAARLPSVELVGAVDREVASEWQRAADVVVCPSRYEGMSLVPLECAALGVPVVASDVEGMRSTLSPAARRLVPPGDAAALASALVATLMDPDPDGTAAETTCWADHIPGHGAAEQVLRVYAHLLGTTSTTPAELRRGA